LEQNGRIGIREGRIKELEGQSLKSERSRLGVGGAAFGSRRGRVGSQGANRNEMFNIGTFNPFVTKWHLLDVYINNCLTKRILIVCRCKFLWVSSKNGLGGGSLARKIKGQESEF
jgi:hypothetical protein